VNRFTPGGIQALASFARSSAMLPGPTDDRATKGRGYQLHAPDSPEAEALLGEHCVTRADLARAQKGLPSAPSPASTTTGSSAPAARAGDPTCPMPAPSRSSRCSGCRSWSCSGVRLWAARLSSSSTAHCRTATWPAGRGAPERTLPSQRCCFPSVHKCDPIAGTSLGAPSAVQEPERELAAVKGRTALNAKKLQRARAELKAQDEAEKPKGRSVHP
jgi:hypothetical protein